MTEEQLRERLKRAAAAAWEDDVAHNPRLAKLTGAQREAMRYTADIHFIRGAFWAISFVQEES